MGQIDGARDTYSNIVRDEIFPPFLGFGFCWMKIWSKLLRVTQILKVFFHPCIRGPRPIAMNNLSESSIRGEVWSESQLSYVTLSDRDVFKKAPPIEKVTLKSLEPFSTFQGTNISPKSKGVLSRWCYDVRPFPRSDMLVSQGRDIWNTPWQINGWSFQSHGGALFRWFSGFQLGNFLGSVLIFTGVPYFFRSFFGGFFSE